MTAVPAATCCLIGSDFHCLGDTALLRPGFQTSKGNEIGLNPVQLKLWDAYQSCLDEARALIVDRDCVVILNGDLVEGNHHRTNEILAVDSFEHARAAAYTLEHLAELGTAGVYVVEGTECHTGELEHWIAKQLDAVPCTPTRPAWPILSIEINGHLGSVRHHMPTTSRAWLEASQMSIQAANAQINAMRAGDRVPTWFAAGHRHVAGYWGRHGALWCVTPSWQALTRYGRKVVPDGKVEVGFIFLDFEHAESSPSVRQITRVIA